MAEPQSNSKRRTTGGVALAEMLKIGALNEKLLRRFFGQYARWWSELLCEKREALADPEWGATLQDINWLFERLKRTKREGSRR